MPKAMIAMSGGVDSSVAAHLMGQQGFDCVGATMKLLAGDGGCGGGRTCCSMDDALDAKAVARALGFPHYTLNFTGEFADAVIRRFADADLPTPASTATGISNLRGCCAGPGPWTATFLPPGTTPGWKKARGGACCCAGRRTAKRTRPTFCIP